VLTAKPQPAVSYLFTSEFEEPAFKATGGRKIAPPRGGESS